MQTQLNSPRAAAPFHPPLGPCPRRNASRFAISIMGWLGQMAGLGIVGGLVALAPVTPVRADADDFCAKIHNDDRLRPYDPGMRPDFVRAFRKLFPDAKGGQSDATLRAEAFFRCMDGKLVACFTGANLPCGKINQVRDNPGAEAFCRGDREARDVPRVATGHGSQFTYRCHAGHAEISGTAWTLDGRGFAKEVWTPLDLD